MAMRRTFTAKEILKLLSTQALNDDLGLNLGGGFIVKQTAAAYKDPEHPSFMLEHNGKYLGNLEDAGEETIKEISKILWDKYEPFITSIDDELTPDALREKPEPENLEPDPLGLTPDHLREIITDPGLARRLAAGTATAEEKLDDLLTPDALKGKDD